MLFKSYQGILKTYYVVYNSVHLHLVLAMHGRINKSSSYEYRSLSGNLFSISVYSFSRKINVVPMIVISMHTLHLSAPTFDFKSSPLEYNVDNSKID